MNPETEHEIMRQMLQGSVQTPSLEKQPQADDFEDLEGYIQALVSWKVEQRLASVQNLHQELLLGTACSGKGFQRLDSTLGRFVVALEGVEKHPDGQRLQLSIGNLQAVRFDGFTITLSWGTKEPSLQETVQGGRDLNWFFDIWLRWCRSVHTQEFTFPTRTLEPGAWNRVDIVLPGASEEDVQHIRLEIQTDKISLQDGQPALPPGLAQEGRVC